MSPVRWQSAISSASSTGILANQRIAEDKDVPRADNCKLELALFCDEPVLRRRAVEIIIGIIKKKAVMVIQTYKHPLFLPFSWRPFDFRRTQTVSG